MTMTLTVFILISLLHTVTCMLDACWKIESDPPCNDDYYANNLGCHYDTNDTSCMCRITNDIIDVIYLVDISTSAVIEPANFSCVAHLIQDVTNSTLVISSTTEIFNQLILYDMNQYPQTPNINAESIDINQYTRTQLNDLQTAMNSAIQIFENPNLDGRPVLVIFNGQMQKDYTQDDVDICPLKSTLNNAGITVIVVSYTPYDATQQARDLTCLVDTTDPSSNDAYNLMPFNAIAQAPEYGWNGFPIEAKLSWDLCETATSLNTITCNGMYRYEWVDFANPVWIEITVPPNTNTIILETCSTYTTMDTILNLYDSTSNILINSDDNGCNDNIGRSRIEHTVSIIDTETIFQLHIVNPNFIEGYLQLNMSCITPSPPTPTPTKTLIPIACGDMYQHEWIDFSETLWFEITVPSNTKTIILETCSTYTTMDTVLNLYDSTGDILIVEDDNGCNDNIGRSRIEHTVLVTDTETIFQLHIDNPNFIEGYLQLNMFCIAATTTTPPTTAYPTQEPTPNPSPRPTDDPTPSPTTPQPIPTTTPPTPQPTEFPTNNPTPSPITPPPSPITPPPISTNAPTPIPTTFEPTFNPTLYPIFISTTPPPVSTTTTPPIPTTTPPPVPTTPPPIPTTTPPPVPTTTPPPVSTTTTSPVPTTTPPPIPTTTPPPVPTTTPPPVPTTTPPPIPTTTPPPVPTTPPPTPPPIPTTTPPPPTSVPTPWPTKKPTRRPWWSRRPTPTPTPPPVPTHWPTLKPTNVDKECINNKTNWRFEYKHSFVVRKKKKKYRKGWWSIKSGSRSGSMPHRHSSHYKPKSHKSHSKVNKKHSTDNDDSNKPKSKIHHSVSESSSSSKSRPESRSSSSSSSVSGDSKNSMEFERKLAICLVYNLVITNENNNCYGDATSIEFFMINLPPKCDGDVSLSQIQDVFYYNLPNNFDIVYDDITQKIGFGQKYHKGYGAVKPTIPSITEFTLCFEKCAVDAFDIVNTNYFIEGDNNYYSKDGRTLIADVCKLIISTNDNSESYTKEEGRYGYPKQHKSHSSSELKTNNIWSKSVEQKSRECKMDDTNWNLKYKRSYVSRKQHSSRDHKDAHVHNKKRGWWHKNRHSNSKRRRGMGYKYKFSPGTEEFYEDEMSETDYDDIDDEIDVLSSCFIYEIECNLGNAKCFNSPSKIVSFSIDIPYNCGNGDVSIPEINHAFYWSQPDSFTVVYDKTEHGLAFGLSYDGYHNVALSLGEKREFTLCFRRNQLNPYNMVSSKWKAKGENQYYSVDGTIYVPDICQLRQ